MDAASRLNFCLGIGYNRVSVPRIPDSLDSRSIWRQGQSCQRICIYIYMYIYILRGVATKGDEIHPLSSLQANGYVALSCWLWCPGQDLPAGSRANGEPVRTPTLQTHASLPQLTVFWGSVTAASVNPLATTAHWSLHFSVLRFTTGCPAVFHLKTDSEARHCISSTSFGECRVFKKIGHIINTSLSLARGFRLLSTR